ncbi:MAG: T9SS type A sorting domain-containing protein, partial [Bacteroidota bacterium]
TKQYYRLKQSDIDGRSTLSNILMIQGEKPTFLEIASVFPNPSKGQVTVLLNAPINETVNVRLTDLSGRIIETRQINVPTGSNSIPFDLSKWAMGQYLISVGEKTVRVVRE